MDYSGGNVDNGRACTCAGQGVHRNSVLSAEFYCEPKTALKISLCKRGGGSKQVGKGKERR